MAELTLERSFSAPPEKVFDFVTKGSELLKWWGPEGLTVPEHALDFTRPGPWFSVMMNSEGRRYKASGEVLQVDPPFSVSFTFGWHDEADKRGVEGTVSFQVRSDGNGGTHFTLIHSGLPDDAAGAHEEGWTSSLRKLERLA